MVSILFWAVHRYVCTQSSGQSSRQAEATGTMRAMSAIHCHFKQKLLLTMRYARSTYIIYPMGYQLARDGHDGHRTSRLKRRGMGRGGVRGDRCHRLAHGPVAGKPKQVNEWTRVSRVG